MTLQQWCDYTGILCTHPTTERGAVSLIAEDIRRNDREFYAQLWHLDDYLVSSVSGIVIWLVPRLPICK